jgi:hypothetical protein
MTNPNERTVLIVGRLHMSFARGVKSNKALDLGLEELPTETEAGGLIRGVGSHFISKEAHEHTKEMQREQARVREEFRRQFMTAPMGDGFYLIPKTGAGRELLTKLEVKPGLTAGVSEWEITTTDEERPPAELVEWGERVKRQLQDVPLGRKGKADPGGLDLLAKLATCPVLDRETAKEIKTLIAFAKLDPSDAFALDRKGLKRSIAAVAVKVNLTKKSPRAAKGGKVVVTAPEKTNRNVGPTKEETGAGDAA